MDNGWIIKIGRSLDFYQVSSALTTITRSRTVNATANTGRQSMATLG